MRKMLEWAHLPECKAPSPGWSVRPFRDVAEVIAGQSPPSETYNQNGEGLPFLQGNADFGPHYPSAKEWCSAHPKAAQAGDTLISVRAPVGEVNRADQAYAIGRGLAAIRAHNFDADLLYQAMQRWRWSLQRVAQGTTFDAVTARHFAQLFVAVPDSPEEQASIARILDAVDTAIECTQNAIDRARDVLRALMQALLPPWIGLKKLPIESMPPSVVDIVKAGEIGRVVNGATPSRTEGRYWSGGHIPWLATGKVHDRFITRPNECVTDVALRECSIELVPKGSVLVAMIGQGRTRGMAAYLGIDATINQNFGSIVPKGKVLGKWLFYYLDYHYHPLRELGGGTNQGALNCYLLKRIRIPVPSIDSQEETIEILEAAERSVAAHVACMEPRHQLKRSLMHDLLTGKVRTDQLKLHEVAA